MSAWRDVSARILVVEDEVSLRRLLTSYLETQGFGVMTAANGREALERLSAAAFDLVLSDIRMPEMDGLALLSAIAAKFPQTSVVMLTACEDVATAVSAMKAGALDYVVKPVRLHDLGTSVRNALERHWEKMREASYRLELENLVERQSVELRHTLANLQDASNNTLEALVAALDAREHETQAHSKRVSDYAVLLAGRVGMDAKAVEILRRGAILHDIGKIGISDNILLKPGELTEDEWEKMRDHPLIGYWILRGVDSLKTSADIVLSHHERFDGSGYPRNLKGEEIPLGARIFAVVDALDAITSDRPYQKGRSYAAARAEIIQNSGSQFDPNIVRHFLMIPREDWESIRRETMKGRPPSILPELAPLVLR